MLTEDKSCRVKEGESSFRNFESLSATVITFVIGYTQRNCILIVISKFSENTLSCSTVNYVTF